MVLSIIIPAYNISLYIENCIISVERNLKNHQFNSEIIIINDGSTDNSLEIINNLSSIYKNIIVLNQENKGQSNARNLGIENAKGKYLMFIDGDDFLNDNVLNDLINLINNKKLDILGFKYQYIVDGKKIIPLLENCRYNVELNPEEFITNGFNMLPVWFCIFRADVVKKFRFKENIYHEDLEIMPKFIFESKKLMMSDLTVYNYVKRDNSSLSDRTNKNFKKICLDNINVAISLNDFFRNSNININTLNYIYKNYINNAIIFTLGSVLKRELILNKSELSEIYESLMFEKIIPLRYNKEKRNHMIYYIINYRKLFMFLVYSKIYSIIIKFKHSK